MQFISSIVLNVLLATYFIIDRIYRLRAIKEYKEAKEAQIALLQQQIDIERRNNDVELAEMHKKRYENIRQLLDDKKAELDDLGKSLTKLNNDLKDAAKEADVKNKLANWLLDELNKVNRAKHDLEVKIKAISQGYNF